MIRNSELVRPRRSCIEMDELAQKNFIYRPSPEEFERYQQNWYITLNTSGKNAPMKLRSDFPRSFNKYAPSSPGVWRRVSCTGSFLPVSEMAFVVFFVQHLMVAVESHGGAHKFIKVKIFFQNLL